jgi:hypothetical protein
MPGLDRDLLHRRWVHSHEEDSEDEMVFRPADFDFPRSRGRLSFELQPGGTLLERRPGPTDRPVEGGGTWELEGGEVLVLRPAGQPEERRPIEALEPDRLVVRT